jgi:hypothetical protein
METEVDNLYFRTHVIRTKWPFYILTFENVDIRTYIVSNFYPFKQFHVRKYKIRTYISRTFVIRKLVILKFNVVPKKGFKIKRRFQIQAAA